jgi:hypothetical protein
MREEALCSITTHTQLKEATPHCFGPRAHDRDIILGLSLDRHWWFNDIYIVSGCATTTHTVHGHHEGIGRSILA